MPSDRRMFDRKIFQSSVCVKLAECNEGKELHAQRLFETLILDADDHGRGKLIPIALRAAAFGTTPTAYSEVSNDDIEKWVKEIEDTGALITWSNDVGERYYGLTGWSCYQAGNWKRQPSKIPDPPEELIEKFKRHPNDPRGSYTEVTQDLNDTYTEVTAKGKERKGKEENIDTPDSEQSGKINSLDEKKEKRIQSCKEFIIEELKFNFKGAQLEKQAIALEKIFRLDKNKIAPHMKYAQWITEIKKVIIWAREDTEPNSRGFCWSLKFHSIKRLREDDCHKLKNMIGGYRSAKAREAARDE